MSCESQGTLIDLEYCDPAAAEISELKTNLEDLNQRHNRISRVMKMSLFANIAFGIISIVLLSLFFYGIKEEQNTGSDICRGEISTNQCELRNQFYAVQF